MLTVISRAPNSKSNKSRWNCICDCGGHSTPTGSSLIDGRTSSCGCGSRKANLKHGASQVGKPNFYLYSAFRNAKSRCNNPNDQDYHNYGALGIQFLFTELDEFITELGPRPSAEHSLDRINSAGNYCIGNIRWSTPSQQSINQKLLSASNTSGYRGVSKSGSRWQANVRANNVQYHLGSSFRSPEEAARAYDAKAKEVHGALARLNFPLA